MSPLERDTDAAITRLVDIAKVLTTKAIKYNETADRLVDKARVVLACADLPGDMPLRVRCLPDVFMYRA